MNDDDTASGHPIAPLSAPLSQRPRMPPWGHPATLPVASASATQLATYVSPAPSQTRRVPVPRAAAPTIKASNRSIKNGMSQTTDAPSQLKTTMTMPEVF
jgi:hypothetical protein